MDVLRLIGSKNRCLAQFEALSQNYVVLFEAGDFSGLAAFESGRASILKAIDLFDRKISEFLNRMPTAHRTPELIRATRELVDEQDRLLASILKLDERIMSRLERARDATLQELNSSHKSRELMQKFKSSWVSESGEEIDRQL